MNTRARFTGRPLSAARTRPVMRPVGAGGVSLFCCAEVSRVGCCEPRNDAGGCCCADRSVTLSKQQRAAKQPREGSSERGQGRGGGPPRTRKKKMARTFGY